MIFWLANHNDDNDDEGEEDNDEIISRMGIWPGNTSIYCQFKLENRSDKDRREPSQNLRGIAGVKVHMKYFVRGADYFADNYLISY